MNVDFKAKWVIFLHAAEGNGYEARNLPRETTMEQAKEILEQEIATGLYYMVSVRHYGNVYQGMEKYV